MASVSGAFRCPSDVAVVEAAGVVYLGLLPGGPISVLEGTAALIWQAALGRDAEETLLAVADRSATGSQAVARSAARSALRVARSSSVTTSPAVA